MSTVTGVNGIMGFNGEDTNGYGTNGEVTNGGESWINLIQVINTRCLKVLKGLKAVITGFNSFITVLTDLTGY